jgi:hypothetical protein
MTSEHTMNPEPCESGMHARQKKANAYINRMLCCRGRTKIIQVMKLTASNKEDTPE